MNEIHDTVLQTQDSKFQPWRSEAEHATSRSRGVHVTRRLYILPTGCTCYLWIVHATYLACSDSCVHVCCFAVEII